MEKSKLVKANEKIAERVVSGYKKIEEGVVGGYIKIEDGAVGGYNKIADKFVDNFFAKEGESVEEAKARLAAGQKAREQRSDQRAIVEENKKAQNKTSEARRKAGLV